MTPQEWEKVGEIYHAVSELEPETMSGFLDAACDGEPALRKEIESLLAAGGEADDFISKPVGGSFASNILNSTGQLPEQLGHYRIIKKIGSGGMGEVFHAEDTKLGRSIALKTLSTLFDQDPSFQRRFRNEARAAATLNHPNVATVYSVEEVGDLAFITMELVDGETLDHLTPEKGLDTEKFLEWLEPIADALFSAHECGIIHRDIKPGNIMVSDQGTPKILDFGLAHIERSDDSRSLSKSDTTAPGQILGTPSYMSPEQADGGSTDARSDIFSFGIVMYEALTGKRPFCGASQGAIVQSILYDMPEPVHRLKPNVPPIIARMITRCLEKSPQKRFQSMREVHSILKDSKAAVSAGFSMDSFARRFYPEAAVPSKLWWAAAAVLVLLISFSGWLFFSTSPGSAFGFDGLTIRKLSYSNNVAYAAISPDGRSVVYVTYEQNGDRSLWLRRISDTNAIQIVPPQPVQYWDCPVFSDDGEQIYYITAQRSATHGTMYRVSSLGGQPRKLIDRVNHLGNLSPDGRRVLFVRYGDADPNVSINTSETRMLSADAENGGDEKVIVTVTGETLVREPKYSPDGRSIYFARRELIDQVEWWSLFSIDLEGGAQKEIVRQRERINEISVLQNGKGLLVNANEQASARRQLFYLSLPDGKMTRITNDVTSYVGISSDREGKHIVTAQRSEENRIWVADVDAPNAAKPLSRDLAAFQNVAWTPNGRLVFDAIENDRVHLWIADADGKNALQLTSSETDDLDPKVSGDGEWIAFVSRRNGNNQIWRMRIDGTGQDILADVPGLTQYPRFEPDGKTIVFRWFSEGATPLAHVSIYGGPVVGVQGLPRAVSYLWATSPDGKYVAHSVSQPGSNDLFVLVRPTGLGEPVSKLDIWPSRIFKWAPDGKTILFQERKRGENLTCKVFQIDPFTGKQKLYISTEAEEILDLAFSRDNKKVAMIRGKTSTDAVILTRIAPQDTK